MASRNGMLMLALSAASSSSAATLPDVSKVSARSIVHKVGACRIRPLSPSTPPGVPRTRAFLIDIGGKRLLVAPTPGASALPRGRKSPLDAVLLTSLSEAALSDLLEGNAAAYGNSRVYVDRGLLEAARASVERSDRSNLNALLASGRLYAPEANVDVVPGVRFTIPPHLSTVSRVRIRCGEQTLIVLDGAELASSGFDRIPAVAVNRDDPAHLTSLAGDHTKLAITSGPFPALASIYRQVDGFRLGSIEAREYGGAAPRRGEVIVEETPVP